MGYAYLHVSKRPSNTLSTLLRPGQGEAGHQDHELLASIAAHDILPATVAGQHPGESSQYLIACLVSEFIVDLLEMIYIDHQQTKGLHGLIPLQGPAQFGIQIPSVIQASQRVAINKFSKLYL